MVYLIILGKILRRKRIFVEVRKQRYVGLIQEFWLIIGKEEIQFFGMFILGNSVLLSLEEFVLYFLKVYDVRNKKYEVNLGNFSMRRS